MDKCPYVMKTEDSVWYQYRAHLYYFISHIFFSFGKDRHILLLLNYAQWELWRTCTRNAKNQANLLLKRKLGESFLRLYRHLCLSTECLFYTGFKRYLIFIFFFLIVFMFVTIIISVIWSRITFFLLKETQLRSNNYSFSINLF